MSLRLHVLPISVTLLALVSFLITYGIAVSRHDVDPFVPYISMAGTNPPESCAFSLMLNITAYLLGACVYLRYLYVKNFARFKHGGGIRWNKVAAWIGMASCFGLDMVANFQVSAFPLPHFIGAFFCFFGGTVYFYFQKLVSNKMIESIENPRLHFFRTALSAIALSLFIVVIGSGITAGRLTPDVKRQWKPVDSGYPWHLVSTVGEWLLVITLAALILTFLPSFTCVSIKSPIVQIEGIIDTRPVEIQTITTSYRS